MSQKWSINFSHLLFVSVAIFRWTKERSVLLVRSLERSKWVHVRPLPHAKNFPAHYDVRRCASSTFMDFNTINSFNQALWFITDNPTLMSNGLPLSFSISCHLCLLYCYIVYIWCFKDDICKFSCCSGVSKSLFCTLWSVFNSITFLLADMYPDFGEKEM